MGEPHRHLRTQRTRSQRHRRTGGAHPVPSCRTGLSSSTARLRVAVSLALAALTGGCGQARPSAAPFDLRFRLLTAPQRQVRIHMTFTGSAAGETSFEVDREWGGVSTGGEDIADVRVRDSQGRTLEVQHPEPQCWVVQHTGGERLEIDYAIDANDHRRHASPDVHRRPILDAAVFHGYGYLVLLHPTDLDGSVPQPVRITWEGFETAGWRTVCSFGVGPEPGTVEASFDALRSAVYMAGDLDVLERRVHGRPVWTAVAGREWTFTADTLATMVQRIVAIEREFFQDFDHPFYLVTAIPIGEPGTGSRSMGGTGLTHSFSLAMLPDTELGRPLARHMGLGGLLAHEMFHEWLGQTVRGADPEELVYWFTEGWTDFYMRRLLLRGGLIEPEEYAVSVDAKLAELFTSPQRNAPNERIQSGFWKDQGLKRLPYLRGDVVAMIADAAIRRASAGGASLDDLMREFVAEARATGKRYGTDEILRRIAARSDPSTAETLRGIVVSGATPELDPDLFAPCLAMHIETMTGFDLGFDFDGSRAAKTIRGVRSGSNAAAAGLRDGQEVRGWSVRFGEPATPVTITIREAGGDRAITYVPAADPVPTPQFFLAPGSQDCRNL